MNKHFVKNKRWCSSVTVEGTSNKSCFFFSSIEIRKSLTYLEREVYAMLKQRTIMSSPMFHQNGYSVER